MKCNTGLEEVEHKANKCSVKLILSNLQSNIFQNALQHKCDTSRGPTFSIVIDINLVPDQF